jgi:RNA polymerase sigma-70 factor (ECF subfamily)
MTKKGTLTAMVFLAKVYVGNNCFVHPPNPAPSASLKIIPKLRTFDRVNETTLLHRLAAQDPAAQKWLYDRYSPMLFAVCRRYLRSREDAEEALVSGLFKVFSLIESYTGAGSFEGWMRRIVVNESLMMLRKNQNLVFPGDDSKLNYEQADTFSIEAELSAREILELLDQLPTGYRTVFNLYVLEGFKHHEIAETLGISINTSKSQLILAKEKLRNLLKIKGLID